MGPTAPPRRRRLARLETWFAGTDGPGRRALPAGELLHPITLFCILVLLTNDWLLKGSGLVPSAITGKLSDFAGLWAAPLATTAALDCLLWLAAQAGAPTDFTLRRYKLWSATALVGIGFVACKTSAPFGAWVEGTAATLGLDWRIATDPTDLAALPALVGALWLGHRHIAKVPLGRLELIERAYRVGRPIDGMLSDLVPCGSDPEHADQLARALAHYYRADASIDPVWEALRQLRQ